jgi:hypothetical protein
MNKLSTAAYSFDVTHHSSGGSTVTLFQTESGKTKVFKIAASGSVAGLINHMNSLTDTLCEQFFNEGNHKKKKEKKPHVEGAVNQIEVSTVPASQVQSPERTDHTARIKDLASNFDGDTQPVGRV